MKRDDSESLLYTYIEQAPISLSLQGSSRCLFTVRRGLFYIFSKLPYLQETCIKICKHAKGIYYDFTSFPAPFPSMQNLDHYFSSISLVHHLIRL